MFNKFVIIADFANVSVFQSSFKRTLIPWTITQIPEVEYTFLDFFTSVIQPKIPGSSPHIYELLSSNTGPQKGSLDPVDSALLIQPVISSFGRFLKYCVCVNGKTESTKTSVSHESTVNAFDVSMDSARQMYLQEHQPPDSSLQPITERNRKDKLYNDIIIFIKSKGLKFNADEVDTSGTKLVRLLCRYFGTLMAIVMFSCYARYQYQKNSIVYQKEIILMY